jgi:hypothetical protein
MVIFTAILLLPRLSVMVMVLLLLLNSLHAAVFVAELASRDKNLIAVSALGSRTY